MIRRLADPALRIALGYAVLSVIWLAVSDALLTLLSPDIAAWLSFYKGTLFVVVTAALLYLALNASPLALHRGAGADPIAPPTCLPDDRQPLAAHSLAVLGSLLALSAILCLPSFADAPLAFAVMTLPVVLSAAVGGIGPGLIASAVAAIGIAAWSAQLASSGNAALSPLPALACMLLSGGSISLLGEGWRRSRRRIEQMPQVGTDSEHDEALRLAAVAFQSRDGMIVTDRHGVILQVNEAFCAVTGYRAEELIGNTPALLSSGRQETAFYRRLWEAIRHEGHWRGHIWNRRKDGGIYPEWLSITAIRNADGEITHYFGEYSDIHEPRVAERKILELAFYDTLTGLPNRRLLHDRLHQALTTESAAARHGALILIDLDRFKTLNDTLGHEFGDHLLIEVSRRLRETLRQTDTAARLGGDEFAVLLQDLDAEAVVATGIARHIADKLRDALAQPYLVRGIPYHLTASMGVALFMPAGESPDNLLKQADLALYRAKDAGRNALHFYDPTLQAKVDRRAEIEAGLRRALKEDELLLHYQPQVDASGRLIGAEALVRWQPPGQPLVSPGDFITVAEETGLILPIGAWVLRAACRQIAEWHAEEATRHLLLAVNISAQQFHQPDFAEQVRTALADSGADPARLKLELTESSVIDNLELVVETMESLRQLGVGFAMDDFGTGHSSLANLKRLPIQQLKIDQGFVRGIPQDGDDCAIARAVIALAQSLHLKVIAEGVETRAQRDFLARFGCRAYQGYLFGRPAPAATITEMARAENAAQFAARSQR